MVSQGRFLGFAGSAGCAGALPGAVGAGLFWRRAILRASRVDRRLVGRFSANVLFHERNGARKRFGRFFRLGVN